MPPEPPRPDAADRAARAYWEAAADGYQAEHGAFLGGPTGAAFVWGPEGRTEDELAVLGPRDQLAGRRVLEVGCGAAQCSTWLGSHGAHAVALDIAVRQLRHARTTSAPPGSGPGRPGSAGGPAAWPGGRSRVGREGGTLDVGLPDLGGGPRDVGSPEPGAAWDVGLPEVGGLLDVGPPEPGGPPALVAATATALPFPDSTFDIVFSAYGAVQFVADLDHLLAQVARVLHPGGRWAFSVTHPIRWAFPDDPTGAGLAVSTSYFDRSPYVERDDAGQSTYAEFHRTLGDYVAAVTRAGFVVDTLIEPEWPDWNEQTWGGWSPLRGWYLPGTLILGATRG